MAQTYTIFLDCQNDHIIQGNLHIQCNPYQINNDIFHKTKKNLICTKIQIIQNTDTKYKHKISKMILRKKYRAGGISFPIFRLYCKSTVVRTVWYSCKNRNRHQWNKIEGPEIILGTYGQLIYIKGDKTIWWRKNILFYKLFWENWTATCEIMKLEHSLIPYTNSKWVKDLKVQNPCRKT